MIYLVVLHPRQIYYLILRSLFIIYEMVEKRKVNV